MVTAAATITPATTIIQSLLMCYLNSQKDNYRNNTEQFTPQ
jgi:hypothetical protein